MIKSLNYNPNKRKAEAEKAEMEERKGEMLSGI
jgi:hypothetical protein